MIARHGKLICFTGVDGSGKTTQAKRLVEWCLSEQIPAVYIWNRGEAGFRQMIVAIGRAFLRTSSSKLTKNQSTYRDYQERKYRMFNNPAIRWVWLSLVRAEHIWQIRSRLIPLLRAGKVVVSDRYIWDSTIDLAVSFGAPEEWVLVPQIAGYGGWFPVPP